MKERNEDGWKEALVEVLKRSLLTDPPRVFGTFDRIERELSAMAVDAPDLRDLLKAAREKALTDHTSMRKSGRYSEGGALDSWVRP